MVWLTLVSGRLVLDASCAIPDERSIVRPLLWVSQGLLIASLSPQVAPHVPDRGVLCLERPPYLPYWDVVVLFLERAGGTQRCVNQPRLTDQAFSPRPALRQTRGSSDVSR